MPFHVPPLQPTLRFDPSPVVAVAPTTDQTTIRVTLATQRVFRVQRVYRYRLEAPSVVEPTPLPSDPRFVLRIHAVQTRPRPTQGTLAPPATLEPYSVALKERTERVTLVSIGAARPRPTRGVVGPPATLEPWSVALQERTIKTVLVPELRLDRRSGHYKLSAPAVVTPVAVFTAPSLSVTNAAVRTRVERKRHGAFSSLPGPVIVGPPTVFSGPRVTEVRTRPRAVHSELSPPTVVTAAAAAPLAPPILVSIAVERRVGRAQRLPFWRLSYPVLVEAALQPPDRRLQIAVTLAPPDRRIRSRRRTFSSLGGPVVIASAPVVTKIQTKLVAIATRIVEVRRAKSKLPGPATLAPPPAPVKTTPTVVLAATKTRADYRRRDVAAVLRKPTVVSTPVAPVVTTIRVKCVPVTHRRRATRFTLRLPATLTADPCRPVLEAIATSDFTPSAITPDSLSPTPLAADPLSLTPLAGDPLSLTPLTPDDLGAPDDPC